jgi:hypothetical protein
MDPPDTVIEAVAFLASKCYVDDFRPSARGIADGCTRAATP